MMIDFGGYLWEAMGIGVIVLGVSMAIGAIAWRRRYRDGATQEARDRATQGIYDAEERNRRGEDEARAFPHSARLAGQLQAAEVGSPNRLLSLKYLIFSPISWLTPRLTSVEVVPMKTTANNAEARLRLPGGGRGLGITEGGVKRIAGKLKLLALEDLDGRCRSAQLANRLRADLEADFGGGDSLNPAQRELVKRAAIIGATLGDQEARWLTGKQADLSVLGMLIDRQRRLFETLGLHHGRQARDVTPSLREYLNGEATE